MHDDASKIGNCQICGSNKLQKVFFVGNFPPVNSMDPVGSNPTQTTTFPLELVRCEDCGLAQINVAVSQTILFPETYPYLSGTTTILRKNFINQRDSFTKLTNIHSGFVVDIGSNDGSLLTHYSQANFKVLGVEPSQAADVANAAGITTLKDYFNYSTATQIKKTHGAADLVTACNVFAHISDVHSVIRSVKHLLKPEGIFLTESHYLLDLLETAQFDTIYHEHLRYYHLEALIRLFSMHEMEIFHVERIPTHGGSIRCFAARRGSQVINHSVFQALSEESAAEINSFAAFANFKARVSRAKVEFFALLNKIGVPNMKMYGVGAPSRASTLISYFGIGDDIMPAIVEVSGSHKLNKYMPGTRIPIIDEEALIKDNPGYALLLSWHIAPELIRNLRRKGFTGNFVVPLPTPMVIT